jgi:hypothetical protein
VDSTTEALTPRFNLFGFVLAIVGGAVAAGVTGFLYHLLANEAGFDYIIAIAVILGAIIGGVVGLAARIGRLRAVGLAALIAALFGVAGYTARYFFEFNDTVETITQEGVDAGFEREDARQQVLDGLASAYPPGGFFGYLQFVAEQGFSIGSRGSSDEEAPIRGGLAWGLLGIEALAAGVVAGVTARNLLKKEQAAPPVGPVSGQPA